MGNGVCLCEVIEANVSDAFPIFHYVVGEGSRQHVRTNMRLGFRSRSGNALHCFGFLSSCFLWTDWSILRCVTCQTAAPLRTAARVFNCQRKHILLCDETLKPNVIVAPGPALVLYIQTIHLSCLCSCNVIW
jgi:hypothetical protein